MPETVYTIPINEAFDHYEGCPMCRLHDKLEDTTLNYSLGAAMMEPNVRIEMNRLGFCNTHFEKMAGMKNKLTLALILESHLADTHDLLSLPPAGGKRSRFSSKQEDTDACENLTELSNNCFACAKIQSTEKRYLSNTVYLWDTNPSFRDKLSKQPSFCVSHAAGLLRYAKSSLKQPRYAEFYSVIATILQRGFQSVKDEVSKFCQSFDHRNSGSDLGNARYCVENSIKLLK